MAIRKYQVFLASRFDEFQILRLALKNQLNGLKEPPIEAVDLNDDMADTRPPLSRSYYAVDNSELFVLLVGDTYGGRPPNSEESYTHLEYRRALTSKKPILPFIIRNLSDSAPQERQIDDRRLQEWVKEIGKNHTPSYLDVSSGWDQLTATIFEQIRERLVEFYLDGEFGVLEATGGQSELILEESIIKRELLASAPRRSFDEVDGKQLLKRFANENAQEALKALELRLPQIAIHHLHKAVDMVPLDLVLGYWLSRLQRHPGQWRFDPCRSELTCGALPRFGVGV